MADIPNIPTPGPSGAVPPPKKETGKVQPKKETVRISLPPKPTAAPTIKLPTLPPGGPTGAPSAAPALSAAHPAPAPRPAAPAPGTSLAKSGMAPAQQRPATMAQRPAAAPAGATVSGLDIALSYTAIIVSLGAAGWSFYVLYFFFKPMIDQFQN